MAAPHVEALRDKFFQGMGIQPDAPYYGDALALVSSWEDYLLSQAQVSRQPAAPSAPAPSSAPYQPPTPAPAPPPPRPQTRRVCRIVPVLNPTGIPFPVMPVQQCRDEPIPGSAGGSIGGVHPGAPPS